MLLEVLVAVAAVLNSLLAGFLFAFAVVVMPGIRALDDAQYVRAFQVVDGVIQRNQPLFMLVWVGSVLTLVAAGVVGVFELDGLDQALVWIALVLGGAVQVITARINIPLNNRLQAVDTAAVPAEELRGVREGFEPGWNQWNIIRTVLAIGATAALIVLALRI